MTPTSPPKPDTPAPATRRPAKRSRRAMATVLALVVLVLVNTLVLSSLLSVGNFADQAASRLTSTRLFYNAETATNMALREILLNQDFDASGEVGALANSLTSPISSLLGLLPSGGSSTLNLTSSLTTVDGLTLLTNTLSTPASGRRILLTLEPREGAGPAASLTPYVSPFGGTHGAAGNSRPGLFAQFYQRTASLSNLAGQVWSGTPTHTGVVPWVDWASAANSTDPLFRGASSANFSVRVSGLINIPSTGLWGFQTDSDDGSDLWINGVRVVNNDGVHGMATASGTALLTAGWHAIEARFFENGGNHGFRMLWRPPLASSFTVIPPHALAHNGAVSAGTPPIRVHGLIDLNGGTIEPWNAAAVAPLLATNATTSQQLDVASDVIVSGPMLVGGTPSVVARVAAGASVGTISTPTAVPVIHRAPQSTVTATGSALNLAGTSTLTLSADAAYTSISLSTNAILTISGHRSVRVTGNVALSNNAAIVIPAGSSLRLVVDGTSTLDNNAAINSAGTPDRFHLIARGTDAGTRITFNKNTIVHGNLHAPRGQILIQDQSRLRGSLLANTLEVRNSAIVQVDMTGVGVGPTSALPRLVGWVEAP